MSKIHVDIAGSSWVARHAPRRPRWVHRVYAWFAGYFWLSCPLCGHGFGGHEWSGEIYYDPDKSSSGHGICSSCARFVAGVQERAR